jgi:hypothetical protein
MMMRKKKLKMATKEFMIMFACLMTGYLMFGGCTLSDREIAECRSIYIREIGRNKLCSQLRKSFCDSMKNWNSRRVLSVRGYLSRSIEWGVDSVILLNRDSSRAIMFATRIYGEGEKFDRIKTIRAQKIGDDWWFYYKGSVEFAVVRSSPDVRPTFEELSFYIVRSFLDDGMKISSDCGFEYSRIDTRTWFKASDMNTHLYEFLQSK